MDEHTYQLLHYLYCSIDNMDLDDLKEQLISDYSIRIMILRIDPEKFKYFTKTCNEDEWHRWVLFVKQFYDLLTSHYATMNVTFLIYIIKIMKDYPDIFTVDDYKTMIICNNLQLSAYIQEIHPNMFFKLYPYINTSLIKVLVHYLRYDILALYKSDLILRELTKISDDYYKYIVLRKLYPEKPYTYDYIGNFTKKHPLIVNEHTVDILWDDYLKSDNKCKTAIANLLDVKNKSFLPQFVKIFNQPDSILIDYFNAHYDYWDDDRYMLIEAYINNNFVFDSSHNMTLTTKLLSLFVKYDIYIYDTWIEYTLHKKMDRYVIFEHHPDIFLRFIQNSPNKDKYLQHIFLCINQCKTIMNKLSEFITIQDVKHNQSLIKYYSKEISLSDMIYFSSHINSKLIPQFNKTFLNNVNLQITKQFYEKIAKLNSKLHKTITDLISKKRITLLDTDEDNKN